MLLIHGPHLEKQGQGAWCLLSTAVYVLVTEPKERRKEGSGGKVEATPLLSVLNYLG